MIDLLFKCKFSVKASTTVLTFDKTSVEKGETVTLTCTVDGSPEPNKPIVTKTALDGTTSRVAVTCTGTIPKVCRKEFSAVLYKHNGNYRCNGKNFIDKKAKSSSDDKDLIVGMFLKVLLHFVKHYHFMFIFIPLLF